MDYLFENIGINWGVIAHDIWHVYFPLFCFCMVLVSVACTRNYVKSTKKEYEDRIDHLRLKNINQGIEIERINSELRLAKEGFTQYKEDAMIEILNLRNEVNWLNKKVPKRKPDGTFAVTTGKGHSKKKRAEIKTTECETTESETTECETTDGYWTKATKEELLAEAKRRGFKRVFCNIFGELFSEPSGMGGDQIWTPRSGWAKC